MAYKILPEVRLGITPTGWRNDDFPELTKNPQGGKQYYSVDQCLEQTMLEKFSGCSLGHGFPDTKAAWDAKITETKAKLPVGNPIKTGPFHPSEPWVSTRFTEPGGFRSTMADFDKKKAFWKAIGAVDLGVAEFGQSVHLTTTPLGLRNRFSEQEWDALVEGLNALGAKAAAEGFRLCYHPHMGTGVQTQPEMDRLMAATNAAHVHLLLDTGHLTWAGGDPVAAIRRHGHRIRHVHLKDLRKNVRAALDLRTTSFKGALLKGIFTVPGDGKSIDFTAVLRELHAVDYSRPERIAPGSAETWRQWLVVEAEQPTKGDFHNKKQDSAPWTPRDYANAAYTHITGILGGES